MLQPPMHEAGDEFGFFCAVSLEFMIDQVCGKVAVIGENGNVAQNSRGLVEFALIVAIATSQVPGGADYQKSLFSASITLFPASTLRPGVDLQEARQLPTPPANLHPGYSVPLQDSKCFLGPQIINPYTVS